MLTIRLSRTGKRHAPQYRIVVQEKTQDPWAPAKEIVGLYNPHTQPSTITFKEDRVKHWLANGAQPSDTVRNMLINAGLLEGEKVRAVTITKKRAAKLGAAKAEAEAKAAAEAEAKKAAEEAAKAEAAAAKAAAAEAKKAEAEAAKAAAAAPAEEAAAEPAKEEVAAEEAKTE